MPDVVSGNCEPKQWFPAIVNAEGWFLATLNPEGWSLATMNPGGWPREGSLAPENPAKWSPAIVNAEDPEEPGGIL